MIEQENKNQIQEIENEMELLTAQYKAQLEKLEMEKVKLSHPQLWEFVKTNFTDSNIYFSRELFNKSNSHIIKWNFKISYANVPVQVQFIDNTKALVVGLEPENNISQDLFEQLVQKTKNIFPFEINIINTCTHLGTDYTYGEPVLPNELNIDHVDLFHDSDKINTIGFYYKT